MSTYHESNRQQLLSNNTMEQLRDNPDCESRRLPVQADDVAPDTTEIRLLQRMNGGSMCHCTLPPRTVSKAVKHKTVDEIWYFVQGQGQVWRKLEHKEKVEDVSTGVSLTLPVGTQFQFRNIGWEALCFLCVTMPPWPGQDEAVLVEDYWKDQTLE